jgi:hypothetical protein
VRKQGEISKLNSEILAIVLTFEDPGGPTIIKGVCDKEQTNVTKTFSFSPLVTAIPAGISLPLITVSIALVKVS